MDRIQQRLPGFDSQLPLQQSGCRAQLSSRGSRVSARRVATDQQRLVALDERIHGDQPGSNLDRSLFVAARQTRQGALAQQGFGDEPDVVPLIEEPYLERARVLESEAFEEVPPEPR